MANKMLIDATHREETRVVVVRGQRIEEFDYESAHRKQLKGNIYLAKVTRVEPSLQAAFVDYGGNRHGFLAFSEIHPDYYQIPVADRQALLREEREDAVHGDDDFENGGGRQADEADGDDDNGDDVRSAGADDNGADDDIDGDVDGDGDGERAAIENVEEDQETRQVDSVGAEDAMEEVPRRRQPRRRSYKIQEVVKRRQVLLVQVVKEERGTKGAALTTYLSLAGRYCVLMPNTARGGGISRKITDAGDRRRLKDVTRDIEVPEGMGLIVRTAGAQRTKAEIRRDYDYLMRLWENVRDLTLKSTAPALVYEEGNLIKRAIRDLYGKEVEEVLVEGEDGYREAKEFMKMLMPSHARNVKSYKDTRPLFAKSLVEGQLDALFSPVVTLPSGGYLVVNQTEALVAIDINSGKSTREHSIEDTALRTNLEAADEIARQLRLRDLAGLIVIDFIDMEEKRNNRAVERRVKESLKHDRARIQVGRISHFGLLEMSRQRLRQGMIEGSTRPCPHCEGTGRIRSIASCALAVLREIEENLTRRKAEGLTVKCHPEVAFYILNEKRDHLLGLETSFGTSIYLQAVPDMKSADSQIERDPNRAAPARKPTAQTVQMDSALINEPQEATAPDDADDAEAPAQAAPGRDGEKDHDKDREAGREDGRRRRRRRRGRRGGRGAGEDNQDRDSNARGQAESGDQPAADARRDDQAASSPPETVEVPVAAMPQAEPVSEAAEAHSAEVATIEAAPKPKRRRASRAKAKPADGKDEDKDATAIEPVEASPAAPATEATTDDAKPATARKSRAKAKPKPKPKAAEPAADAQPMAAAPQPEVRDTPPPPRWTPPTPTAEPSGPPKRGWWAKRTGADHKQS